MTAFDLETMRHGALHDGERGLAADFAHAIGLDHAVRSAMELPAIEVVAITTEPLQIAPMSPQLAEIKARLAARGLLATKPQVLVPKEPRGDASGITTTLGTFADIADDAEVSELDEWDVQPGREEAPVRCRQCRDTYIRPLEATRFWCPSCERGWRWAVCSGCDQLSFPLERQESWRCGCGTFNRSWWRTSTAMRDAIDVVARRKHEAVEAERRLVREGMRRRRWKLIAFAVWAAVAAVLLPLGVRLAQSEGGGTATACAHWMRLRADITNGAVVGEALDAQLRSLSDEAATAAPAVQEAVGELVGARVGSSAFLAARAALSDACEAH